MNSEQSRDQSSAQTPKPTKPLTRFITDDDNCWMLKEYQDLGFIFV